MTETRNVIECISQIFCYANYLDRKAKEFACALCESRTYVWYNTSKNLKQINSKDMFVPQKKNVVVNLLEKLTLRGKVDDNFRLNLV